MSAKASPTEEVEMLVGRLCTDHHLWAADAHHRVLSRGDENLVIEVADEFIVRLSNQPAPQRAIAVATESRLLNRLSPALDVAIPEFLVVDEVAGVLIYRKLPGLPYLQARSQPSTPGLSKPGLSNPGLSKPGLSKPQPAASLTRQLGAVLRTLHRLSDEVDLPHDDHPLELWLVEATSAATRIDPYLTTGRRTLLRQFLATPPPANPIYSTLCHNDLGAEHLLVDPNSGALTGIIDWTDAALTDPARDVALIQRDLGPTAATAVARIAEIAEPSLLERATFLARCKWIEDCAYALDTNATDEPARAQYLDNAHSTFRHTFVAV